ncbi:hypothetical protein ACU635_27700 [[Actinomadura] parvosata]
MRDFGRHADQARFEEPPQLAVLTTTGGRPAGALTRLSPRPR